MLKQDGQKPYRFYRPRRPGGMGDGLKLEGVTSIFGILGIVVLLLVGAAMLMISNIPTQKDLVPVSIEVQAPAYRTPKLPKSVLIPVTRARVLALDDASFAVADTHALYTLKKGEFLRAWLLAAEAEKWNNKVARKDFYKAMLLQKTDKSWIVDYNSYHKKARIFNNQGWWLIIFGILLIPYQLIRKPKIPAWMAISGFIAIMILWSIFM